MIKITYLFIFALIGAALTLPASDSVNQRDPVQIKISNEDPPISALENNGGNEPLTPLSDEEEIGSFNPDVQAIKGESLEPAETFGFGYGLGYSGWGGRYNGYGGYGGWGQGYGGYGGYGGRGYGGNGWRRGYGGYGRRSYYW
ncbi:hypothetical protein HA402_015296 [Bradysia odoriphaga]|nr:hypothetical protein HA402_015296 [Bradysia odoriphaga]